MGYSNLFGSPSEYADLYGRDKEDRDRFLRMKALQKRDNTRVGIEENNKPISSLSASSKPDSLFTGLKQTVAGWRDPKVISEDEFKKAQNNLLWITDQTTVPSPPVDNRTSVNAHGDMGNKEQFNPFTGESMGFTPTQGTVQTGSDAPAGEIVYGTHEEYTKQLDTTFLAAALQSAVPEKKSTPTPRLLAGGGAYGGGENLGSMQSYSTGERPKKKNPALWRYHG